MTGAVRPTKKQRELLSFITDFIVQHGYSPSYREIMTGLNYGSVATVAAHVANLIRRGHLRKRDHSARSLEVVDQPVEQPIKTNALAPAEEKWLVEKVEHYITQAEAEAIPEAARLADITTLLAALRVLGLDGAAQSFVPRLHELEARLTPGDFQA